MLKNVVESLNDQGHSTRVAKLTYKLSMAAGLNEKDCRLISRASRLHDIGKIAIPNKILNSTFKLSASERAIIEKHVLYGLRMIEHFRGEEMEVAKTIIATHHEKWNGTGYPKKLKGTEIPLAGRIVAICDVYDSLRSERSYKTSWPAAEANQYVESERGEHFDPELVDLFLGVVAQ